MSMLSKYCPTYTRWCVWLWHSPTFTTWGNYAAQSLRLLLVTPLILTRFDETEIAAWYLFASLNFFGTTISQRLGLTFSRMFAFAMGGASNLAPIKGKRAQENEGQPNWGAFERAYGTIGSLNLGIGGLNVLIALGMGWFGLSNLLQGYEAKGVIWLAFALMQGSSLLSFTFQRYGVALQGMNYVALSNRWGIIFSLLSIAAGSLALWLGGGLVTLVLVMQFFGVVGVFLKRFLLHAVEEGRVLRFRQYGFDREVFSWAWEPTWKGFIGQFGMQGSAQLTAVIYTTYGNKLEVASFLFSVGILRTLVQVSQAPFTSAMPLMSRILSKGDMAYLSQLYRHRVTLSISLLGAGVISVGILFPWAMEIIDAKIQFLPNLQWYLLGLLMLFVRFNVLCYSASGLGNQIVFYKESALAALIGCCGTFVVANRIGSFSPILFSTIPLIILWGYRPFLLSKKIMAAKFWGSVGSDFTILIVIYSLCVCVIKFI